MLTQPGQEKMDSVKFAESQETGQPVFVIARQDAAAAAAPAKSGRLTKKHVLIASISVIITALIVTAVLVGIHLFMRNNVETLKLSLTLKNSGAKDVKQNVSVDGSANIIITQLTVDGNDIIINDDLDKDIQLFKIRSATTVGCYATPLNRSHTFDPKSFPMPVGRNVSNEVVKMDVNSTGFAVYMSYDVAPTAIIDSTFLGKRANALCYNIPIYWLQPTCSGKLLEPPIDAGNHGNHDRQKRSFSCKCGLKYCTKKIFGITIFKYVCGAECKCCLNSVCLSVNTSCAACLSVSSSTQQCVKVC